MSDNDDKNLENDIESSRAEVAIDEAMNALFYATQYAQESRNIEQLIQISYAWQTMIKDILCSCTDEADNKVSSFGFGFGSAETTLERAEVQNNGEHPENSSRRTINNYKFRKF